MGTRSSRRHLAVGALALALVAAACGGSDDSDDAAATTAAPAAGGASTTAAAPEELVPVRFAAIVSAGQGYLPEVLESEGIAEKYGFDIEVTEIAEASQQWSSLRAGEVDVASGSVVDLFRQRGSGLDVHAFRTYLTWDSPIMVKAGSDIETFEDLKGKKVGIWNANALDFLIVRAAGAKAHGVDLATDASLVEVGPALLPQLLRSGEVDAVLSFSSLAYEPLATGEFTELTSVPELIDEGGFDPDAFRLLYMVSDEWLDEHPDKIDDLRSAFDEGFEVLTTDDEIWPELASVVGVTDPKLLEAYVAQQRAGYDAPYSADLVAPTQTLVDALVALVGPDVVGVSNVDPAAFLFQGS